MVGRLRAGGTVEHFQDRLLGADGRVHWIDDLELSALTLVASLATALVSVWWLSPVPELAIPIATPVTAVVPPSAASSAATATATNGQCQR